MRRESLAGTYKLVSWQRPEGTYPFGRDAQGIIQYDLNGRMSVQLMKADRPLLGRPLSELLTIRKNLSRPWKVPWGVLIRYLKAATSYMAYSGAYDFDGDEVRHHLDLALVPDMVGMELMRHVELDGPMLRLLSDEGDIVEWQKIAAVAEREMAAESPS